MCYIHDVAIITTKTTTTTAAELTLSWHKSVENATDEYELHRMDGETLPLLAFLDENDVCSLLVSVCCDKTKTNSSGTNTVLAQICGLAGVSVRM